VIIHHSFTDVIDEAALIRVVGQNIRKMRKCLFQGSLLKKKVAGCPPPFVTGRKCQNGFFQCLLGMLHLTHSLKDLGQTKPVFLFERILLDRFLKILTTLP
jgi:hypothetical protein